MNSLKFGNAGSAESPVGEQSAKQVVFSAAVGIARHQNMDIHWLAIINSFVLMLLILPSSQTSAVTVAECNV